MTTHIIGHKKPDTDSVVAAMALEYLYKNVECFGYGDPQANIIDPLNPETTYLFKKFEVTPPPLISNQDIKGGDRVILVDHNEENQRLDNLDPARIVEIIDHHKANLNLNSPIFMTFKAWGSTATIIYFMMKQNNLKPDSKLAALMLAAILSDTVGFKSPTTTDKDREIGDELAKIAGIDNFSEFTLEIFKAKSDVSSLSDEQIVLNDYKIFEFGKKTLIDQIETVEQDLITIEKKDDILKAMRKVKQDQGVELLFVVVTDILQINSKILILGDDEAKVAKDAFGGEIKENVLDIGPKMSRKKEIAPVIERVLG